MRKHKKLIQRIAFLLITLLLFMGISEGMKGTEPNAVCSIWGIRSEPKNSIDMVFMGASEAYASFCPGKAWEEFGFTSFDVGSPAAPGTVYKPMLQEILRHQSPSVVVIEINGFIHGDEYMNKEPKVRNVIDNMSLSGDWVQAIRENVAEEDRFNYYFPINTYHSNWSNMKLTAQNLLLKVGMSARGRTYTKGFGTTSLIDPYESQIVKGNIHFEEKCRSSLEDLLQYCQQAGLKQVLFIRAPHIYIPENGEELEPVWDLIRSYGYDTLDLSSDLSVMGLDTTTDFYNEEHVNIDGCLKFTSYLGKWITENYEMNTEHSEAVISDWNEAKLTADRIIQLCHQNMKKNDKHVYNETFFCR